MAAEEPPPPPPTPPAPARWPRALLVAPLAFTGALAALGLLLPQARESARLQWSHLGAVAVLLVWAGALFVAARRRGRTLAARFVVRRPHWMQPIVQITLYAYWGWYWRPVYDNAPLMASQLVFAYAFDMLLGWSRRDTIEVGFGPLPIIGSMGFFLLFKPDWFYLQFALVAFGFAAKELLRWQRDGRRTHIFNPSSFPLAVASLLLLASGTTDLTLGNDIARTLERPPHIFELVFAVALPAQILFGVTTMAIPALVTTFSLTLAYYLATGTYYFFATIPLPIFFGMLLLVTDPATSPKTELGRMVYGALYGVSAVALYGLLDCFGQPTFYDKLLAVPLLNLSVRALDRLATTSLGRIDPGRLWRSLTGRRRNLAYVVVWAAVFAGVEAAEGIGDAHPGNLLPFWEQACKADRRNACRNLRTMESAYCAAGSGWACNELAIAATEKHERQLAPSEIFARACSLGLTAGCDNAAHVRDGVGALAHAPPSPGDYDVMLDPKRRPDEAKALDLWVAACDQGWMEACMNLGYLYLDSDLVPRDPERSARAFDKACAGDHAQGCSMLALAYHRGAGVPRDELRALTHLTKACDLGLAPACSQLAATKKHPTEPRP